MSGQAEKRIAEIRERFVEPYKNYAGESDSDLSLGDVRFLLSHIRKLEGSQEETESEAVAAWNRRSGENEWISFNDAQPESFTLIHYYFNDEGQVYTESLSESLINKYRKMGNGYWQYVRIPYAAALREKGGEGA